MKKWILIILMLFAVSGKIKAQFTEAQQCIGSDKDDIIMDMQKTADSGWIMLYKKDTIGGMNQRFTIGYTLVKLNTSYEIEWTKDVEQETFTMYNQMLLTQDENFLYLRYITAQLVDSVSATYLHHIQKMDLSGNIKWHLTDTILPSSVAYTGFFFSYPQIYMDTKLLKNNTLLYCLYKDTSVIVNNIDLNGNRIWHRTYTYDSIYRIFNNTNYAILINTNMDLQDSTILLCNTITSICFGFCNTVNKTYFIKLDYNGNLLGENSADSSFYLFNKISENDTDLILYYNSYDIVNVNKYSLSATRVPIAINEGYLQPMSINYGNQLRMQVHEKILCLQYVLDSSTQVNKNYLSLYDFKNNVPIYKTYLNSGSFGYTLYNLPDNNFLLSYFNAEDNHYYLLKINNRGNIIYNKLLSTSIDSGETSTSNLGQMLNADFFTNHYYNPDNAGNLIYGNKIYTYGTWTTTDTLWQQTFKQRVMIHDIETGNLEFEYVNNLKDSALYKFVAPYSNDEHKLFILADFNGVNSCRLGGFDISMTKVNIFSNKVFGKGFIDYNSNNIQESNEPPYGLAFLQSSKGNNTLSTYMYGNSYTVNYVDTGTWITKLIPHHPYYDINPVSFISSHAAFGNSDTVLFALHPTRIINDLKVSLVNPFITRLGRGANYEITYANEGTHPANGTIKMVLDNRLSFTSASPGIISQNGDTLVWNFSNLAANETRKIGLSFNVAIPPVLNIGDTLHSMVQIEPIENDSTPNDNKATLDESVRYAYDPNDKTATSGSTITPAQIQQGDYITYVVRFQNTGNDTAFRIVIEDTLDANLDWSTLQPVNTSHAFTMLVVNKNIIQFTFSNLVLPPASINEAASHGFIAYKVKPKSDLPSGSTIKNTAHIYFDFNPPVTTNTVTTQVALVSAIKNHSSGEGKVSVYPNPNNGIFNLEFTANYTSPLSISLYDITGKLVYQNQLQHHQKSVVRIDTQNLAGGMYTVILKTDKEQLTEKIMIDK